jgi:choline dehydrogenase
MESFDYVIVGAGAAGSVLARRLSDDPTSRVLLLENGARDWNPLIHIPKGFYFTLRGSRYAYRYRTQPVGPGGQSEEWVRGKVLGGSTAVNAMMYLRGAAADWNRLAEEGMDGWDWPTVLGAYRSMEDHSLGASPTRGAGGPLGVTIAESDDEVTAALLASAQRLGWTRAQDVNEADDQRIGFTPSTIRNGLRSTSFSAFVRPVLTRPNLTVLTNAKAGYLLFDGPSRVVGVLARHRGAPRHFRARREVILSAGTIESTLLLERSGIGNPQVLARAGVSTRVDSPNVGERVLEQRAVSMQVRLNRQVGPTTSLNTVPKQGWEGAKYLATRRGHIATGGYDLVAQFKSRPQVDRPDVQGIWVPMALDKGATNMQLKLAQYSGVFFTGYQIRPTTQSSIHLGGQLPENAPIINARFLEDEEDREATARILDAARQVASSGPLGDLVDGEDFPGRSVTTHDEVVRYSLDAGTGIYHAVGANAMGHNADDVVDARLRVRGVRGLRVADVSVLPFQVAGNTQAPAMAIGWIAAGMIHDEHQ